MEPLLSVIVPVYKVEPYLRKCVDSILNQTYRNLEIILVDDGSPDRCGAICDEYAAMDERVRVIHKANGGQASARNIGLEQMTGEYVTFVDSDDCLQPELYKRVMKLCPFAMSVFGCTLVSEDGREIAKQTPCTQSKTITIQNDYSEIERLVHTSLLGYAWNKVYFAKLVDGLKFQNIPLREDLVFNLEALGKTAQILLLDECGYYYLQRTDSTLHGFYSGNIPEAGYALEKLITIPSVKDKKRRRKLVNHIVKVYLTDFIYKYIAFNSNLSEEEKRKAIRKLFDYPKVRRVLRFYRKEGKLFFLFTLCYKLRTPGVFYLFMKGIWDNERENQRHCTDL